MQQLQSNQQHGQHYQAQQQFPGAAAAQHSQSSDVASAEGKSQRKDSVSLLRPDRPELADLSRLSLVNPVGASTSMSMSSDSFNIAAPPERRKSIVRRDKAEADRAMRRLSEAEKPSPSPSSQLLPEARQVQPIPEAVHPGAEDTDEQQRQHQQQLQQAHHEGLRVTTKKFYILFFCLFFMPPLP